MSGWRVACQLKIGLRVLVIFLRKILTACHFYYLCEQKLTRSGRAAHTYNRHSVALCWLYDTRLTNVRWAYGVTRSHTRTHTHTHTRTSAHKRTQAHTSANMFAGTPLAGPARGPSQARPRGLYGHAFYGWQLYTKR
jgi:hypothetical protein